MDYIDPRPAFPPLFKTAQVHSFSNFKATFYKFRIIDNSKLYNPRFLLYLFNTAAHLDYTRTFAF
jgi:hypothetical protein